MGFGMPLVSAVLSRLPEAKINLAAFGGIVFPLALLIEAPIIMLLSASTALSRDLKSYRFIQRFMWISGLVLTAVHALVAFTPLFEIIVGDWMKAPPEIIPAGRLGLMLFLPWTGSIAYRRFNQGVLIRYGHTRAVGIGTAIRLLANAAGMTITLLLSKVIGSVPGIAVGAIGISSGVLAEAIYVSWRIRPLVRGPLTTAPTAEPGLDPRSFFGFYWPLALTSLLIIIQTPMGSVAMSRMPAPLDSLAVWPIVSGFLFMWRSTGYAYNEVVISMLDKSGDLATIRRFAILLVLLVSLALGITAVTPLAEIWFVTVTRMPADLLPLAKTGLLLGILWPALEITRNYFQGILVQAKNTQAIPEGVGLFLVVAFSLLWIGIRQANFPGVYVAIVAFVIGLIAQNIWMWIRSRPHVAAMDVQFPPKQAPAHVPAAD
jgi:hypothetical protein